jgi:RHS repeat-associated protein
MIPTQNIDAYLAQVETKPSGGSFTTRSSNFTYTAAGVVSGMQLGNGLWESTVFNNRLQTTAIKLGTTSGGTDRLSLAYGYGSNNNGNITSQTITVPGLTPTFQQAYTYDALNRIATAGETYSGSPTWSQTYGYDQYGNRNITAGTGVTNLSFGSTTNRITSTGFSYDSAGNTTAASGQVFTYDGENKQVSVTSGGGTIGQYQYDGDGKRVKKYNTSTNDNTIFVYDAAGVLIEEYSTSNPNPGPSSVITSYLYAGSRLLSTETASGTNYLTADHLGSPRINTNGSGSVVARHDYMPFGEEIFSSLTSQRTTGFGYTGDTVRKQFTGYERDTESGMDFAQARYFPTTLGRFTTPDPYNVILEKERGANADERAQIFVGFISSPQRWNMYVYVVNNPLAFTDPDGQKPRTINVFIDGGVLTQYGIEEWRKWAAEAQRKDKELTVNIFVMTKETTDTINAFLESLTKRDTATIFMGHSFYPDVPTNQRGISVSGVTLGNSQDQRKGTANRTADGIDIQNAVLAVFSCGFGPGFNNITSSSGTAFVSIAQGQQSGAHLTTFGPATNAAAFRFTESIAKGSWSPITLPGELSRAKDQGQSGIYDFPHPSIPQVNAGDRVVYRILPPPRARR